MGVLKSLASDGGKLSWVLVGLLVLAILENLVDGDLIWTAFLGITLAILVLPAVVFRNPSAMLPPEVTAMAVLPAVTRVLGPAWMTEYATYIGVARRSDVGVHQSDRGGSRGRGRFRSLLRVSDTKRCESRLFAGGR